MHYLPCIYVACNFIFIRVSNRKVHINITLLDYIYSINLNRKDYILNVITSLNY